MTKTILTAFCWDMV